MFKGGCFGGICLCGQWASSWKLRDQKWETGSLFQRKTVVVCVGVDACLGIYPGLSCPTTHQTRGTALSGTTRSNCSNHWMGTLGQMRTRTRSRDTGAKKKRLLWEQGQGPCKSKVLPNAVQPCFIFFPEFSFNLCNGKSYF